MTATVQPAVAQPPDATIATPEPSGGFAEIIVDKPETWINRPLSGKRDSTFPAKYNGMTYTILAASEETRLYLARDRRADPFAKTTLKLIAHSNLCECSACAVTAQLDEEEQEASEAEVAGQVNAAQLEAASEAALNNPTEGPVDLLDGSASASLPSQPIELEPDPVVALVTTAPLTAAPTPVVPTQKPVAAAPPSKPPQSTAAIHDASKKIKLKKQSAAGVERAEASLEEAKRALEITDPLDRLLRDAETEEDQRFVADSVERGSYIADANRKTNRDDILKKIALRIDINNGWAAAWAAKQILLYEDLLADAKRQAQAIVERAERNYEIRDKALMPKLVEYAKSVPIDQRASEKSIRPPGWSGRLTFRWCDEDFEITNEGAARQSVEEKLGTDECIAQGILKVEERLSGTAFREYLLADKEKAKIFQGVRYVAGHDKLTLYRR